MQCPDFEKGNVPHLICRNPPIQASGFPDNRFSSYDSADFKNRFSMNSSTDI